MPDEEFVLPTPLIERHRGEIVDIYGDGEDGSKPLVVFVHGGPVAPESDPRDHQPFAGYASLIAGAGAIGAMFNHRLYLSLIHI